MSDLLFVIFGAALVNNIIVDHMVGADPAIAVQRRLPLVIDTVICLFILLPIVTVSSYFFMTTLLQPLQLKYLALLSHVIIILISCLLLKEALRIALPALSARIADLLPFAAVNTTVLGTILLYQQSISSLWSALAVGFGTALGFAMVLCPLGEISDRLEGTDVPAPFQGIPVQLLTLAIAALAFQGFRGIF